MGIESPIPCPKTEMESMLLSIPLSYRQLIKHINYKYQYNLRISSRFEADPSIRVGLMFVSTEVFTESLLVNLFKSLTPKVIIQTIRGYILPLISIFSKCILKFHYISRLNSYYVKVFSCTPLYFIITFEAWYTLIIQN